MYDHRHRAVRRTIPRTTAASVKRHIKSDQPAPAGTSSPSTISRDSTRGHFALLPNLPLWDLALAAPTWTWLARVVSSPARPVRLRLLRAGRTGGRWSLCATASEQAGCMVSHPIQPARQRPLIPAASDVPCLTGHGTHPDESRGRVPGSRDRILRRLRSSLASLGDGTSGPRRAMT